VDVSPQGHSQGKIEAYRVATVEAAKLEPSVGSVQYGTLVGNGVASQWVVVFNEEKFNLAVHYEDKRKDIWGRRIREIGYTLSVNVV